MKNNVGADKFFYGIPRICYHVDMGFLGHLTDLYRSVELELTPHFAGVLRKMSPHGGDFIKNLFSIKNRM